MRSRIDRMSTPKALAVNLLKVNVKAGLLLRFQHGSHVGLGEIDECTYAPRQMALHGEYDVCGQFVRMPFRQDTHKTALDEILLDQPLRKDSDAQAHPGSLMQAGYA